MKPISILHPTDLTPAVPDTVGAIIISSAAAVVAQDWPAGTDIALFAGTVDFYVNFASTSVAVPSTNSAGTTASSGLNELNPGIRQIGGSTGYSITGPSSGVVTASFWKM